MEICFFSYTVLLAGLPSWDAEISKVSLKIFAQLPMRKYIARAKDYIGISPIDFFLAYTPAFYCFCLLSLD